MVGGGNAVHFEALQADLCAAAHALPETALLEAENGLLDHRQLPVPGCALAEEQFFLVGEDRLVGGILGVFRRGCAALLYSGKHGFLQHLFLLEKFLFIKTDGFGGLVHSELLLGGLSGYQYDNHWTQVSR